MPEPNEAVFCLDPKGDVEIVLCKPNGQLYKDRVLSTALTMGRPLRQTRRRDIEAWLGAFVHKSDSQKALGGETTKRAVPLEGGTPGKEAVLSEATLSEASLREATPSASTPSENEVLSESPLGGSPSEKAWSTDDHQTTGSRYDLSAYAPKHLDRRGKLDMGVLEAVPPVLESGKVAGIRLRASSRHLELASPTLERQLSSQTENQLNTGPRILVEEWHLGASLTVLSIIHNRHRYVPEKVGLTELANIAVIAEHLECADIIRVFVDRWLLYLTAESYEPDDQTLRVWLYISWVFSLKANFKTVAPRVLQKCEQRLSATGWRTPVLLDDMVENKRVSIFREVLRRLEDLRQSLEAAKDCDLACSAYRLGLLQFHMSGTGLDKLADDFRGRSVGWLEDKLRAFSTPDKPNFQCHLAPVPCKLEGQLRPVVKFIASQLESLRLES